MEKKIFGKDGQGSIAALSLRTKFHNLMLAYQTQQEELRQMNADLDQIWMAAQQPDMLQEVLS
jgi:hypothetical protein